MAQRDQILEHLRSGKSITAIDALNLYGCFRLAARIYDLRRKGLDIKDEPDENGKGYSVYSLKKDSPKDKPFGENTCECGGVLLEKDFNGYKFKECFKCKKRIK